MSDCTCAKRLDALIDGLRWALLPHQFQPIKDRLDRMSEGERTRPRNPNVCCNDPYHSHGAHRDPGGPN